MSILHNIISNNVSDLYCKLQKSQKIRDVLLDKNTKHVLDIGIGNGISALKYKEIKNNITIEGLDIVDDLWNESRGIKNTVYDGNIFPFKNNSFELLLIFFVIHHCKNPRLLLSEAMRVTRKYVLILEEVQTSKIQKFLMVFYDFLINFLIFRHFIPRAEFRNNKELEELFTEANLKVINRSIIKDSILVKRVAYLLEKDS